ncbi:MAG: hypothetical protein IRZ14_17870 [Chloroflexi bacterium]|nr:hypothetical protein [Chloroflexota bacterium]
MRIVVNHLTRMQPGYICVAGLDWESGQHVRPLPPEGRLRAALLAQHGGPFALGAIVELGETRPVGHPPEVEDHRFAPRAARQIGLLSPRQLWETLQAVSAPRLRTLFGDALTPRGRRGCGVDYGAGSVSLGCLVPTGPLHLYIQPREGRPGQVRLRVGDGEFDLDLAVTDITLYGPDHVQPDTVGVARVSAALRAGHPVLLSVGLTRAMTHDEGIPPTHWLQVNNIHLEPGDA